MMIRKYSALCVDIMRVQWVVHGPYSVSCKDSSGMHGGNEHLEMVSRDGS